MTNLLEEKQDIKFLSKSSPEDFSLEELDEAIETLTEAIQNIDLKLLLKEEKTFENPDDFQEWKRKCIKARFHITTSLRKFKDSAKGRRETKLDVAIRILKEIHQHTDVYEWLPKGTFDEVEALINS